MGSVSISILENKKGEYERKLATARRNLQNNEAEYSSLVEFKEKVQRSQEVFHVISTREAELLADIRPYYDYNKCVKIFTDTITRFLDGIGTRIVKLAYGALLRMAGARVTSIYSKIEDLNDAILRYHDAIEDINDEIAYQKSMGGQT